MLRAVLASWVVLLGASTTLLVAVVAVQAVVRWGSRPGRPADRSLRAAADEVGPRVEQRSAA